MTITAPIKYPDQITPIQSREGKRGVKKIPKTPQSEDLLTLCLGQVGEERLEASGEPLHALVEIGQSLQVADVTQDLILGDQLVSEVPGQHLRLFGKGHPK